MSGTRKDGKTRPPPSAMPRSPSEALEPTRAPARPRGAKGRREVRRLSPFLRAINNLLTVVVVLLGVVGGAAVWVDHETAKPGPLAAPKSFVVRKGEGARDIAQRLESEGVIASQHMFVANYVARSLSSMFGGKSLQLKAGDYLFEPGDSIDEVSEIIGEGKSVLFSITIPEGLTSHQIVERLRAEPGLTGDVDRLPPEGSLMPDTYKVTRGMNRQAIIDMMQSEQQKFVQRAWSTRAQGLPLKSPQDAVVLASIVEKETGRRDEREKVAAVFINRLRTNMKLQSDPTILYGLHGSQVSWGRPITRADIQSQTAHNTYVIPALPPTPICNPGRAAIQAVLAPAKTNALFFVANGSGGHTFTDNLKDHNAAVAQWRRIEKDIRARQAEAQKAGGKSASAQPAPAVDPQQSQSAGPGVLADDPDADPGALSQQPAAAAAAQAARPKVPPKGAPAVPKDAPKEPAKASSKDAPKEAKEAKK